MALATVNIDKIIKVTSASSYVLPVLFSAGDRRTYFNIPPPLSVDLGLLTLALLIAKELEN